MANRILIVDDAAFMRMMIRDILTKNGYEVVGEAQDGAQAIEKFKELKSGFDHDGYHDARNGRYC